MYPATRKLGKAHLGATTFCASAHPSESCGSNGLPLTPNSIRVYGRARALQLINHPHLCVYVDVHRGKHERLLVVQEYYQLNLRSACNKYPEINSIVGLTKVAYQVLQAIIYLNNFGSVFANLSPENILIDNQGQVKVYNYGLYFMTESGSAVSFPVGRPQYAAPELLILEGTTSGFGIIGSSTWNDLGSSGTPSVAGNPAWDVWSLGIILVEMIIGKCLFEGTIEDIVCSILSLAFVENPLDVLAGSHSAFDQINALSSDFKDFLLKCLAISPSQRPLPCDLLNHSIFSSLSLSASLTPFPPHFPLIDPESCLVNFAHHKEKLGVHASSYHDKLKDYPHYACNAESQDYKKKPWRFSSLNHLSERSIREVYHLWQLAGGDVEQELKKQQLITTKPPILNLPSVMVVEGELFGGDTTICRHLTEATTTVILPLDSLYSRLCHIQPQMYYPLITQGESGSDQLEMKDLPVVIRERDAEYQFHRLVVFERLLKAYPYKSDSIQKESRQDIPPHYRAQVWAALLQVDGAVCQAYEEIDKETPTATDRQIEVDIPRCHQYDELLSSPQGHIKFTRVLKAWVAAHPGLVYWQGLDSLCAPFLYLNFNNEALAFACLSNFIDKYLHKFFLKDNSAVIQEYLAKFSQMIAFHDPQLFNHLDNIGFIPELYAIPWFLTMYTHVFPLHKIFLLWDTLLLGEASLPLCIGVSILHQLRDRLLTYGFNECILLFSDLPDIDMESVVKHSVVVFCSTPASVTYRQHMKPPTQPSKPDSPSHKISEENEELMMCDGPVKGEKVARISGADVLELLAHKRNRGGRGKFLLVDARSTEEFNRGTLSNAINLPADTLFAAPNDSLVQCQAVEILHSYHGKIIVVIGSRNHRDKAKRVAEGLVRLNFPRVCLLHRGVEVFRGTADLIIPC